MEKPTDLGTACSGGCGKKDQSPAQAGWQLLPITGRWRCHECTRELAEAGKEKKDE